MLICERHTCVFTTRGIRRTYFRDSTSSYKATPGVTKLRSEYAGSHGDMEGFRDSAENKQDSVTHILSAPEGAVDGRT